MKLKCKVIKQVFKCSNYQILGCIPIDNNDQIMLNKYGNFSIKDSMLILSEGKEYTVEIEETEFKGNKSYILKSVPSMQIDDIKSITDEMEREILYEITSPDLAEQINKSYPNYVRMILQGEQDDIDLKKIKGVKEVRHALFVRLINEKFKYYYIIEKNRQYELELKDCKELCKLYPTVEKVNDLLDKKPYFALIKLCGKSFDRADRILKEVRPDLLESDQRVEFLMLDVLSRNEYDGSTYMNANVMAQYTAEVDKNLTKKLKEVAIKSELIFYDDETKNIAKLETYLAEQYIANTLLEKLANPIDYKIDYTKYQEGCTDEQLQLLKLANEQNIVLLTGGSGVGKTFTARSLIHMLDDNDLTYTLVTPTGISAKRLSESTGRDAGTIHRKILPFVSQCETISTDYLICDEFGMCGVELTNWLCKALSDYTKLILICDDAQLVSIQCGNCLTDILNSGKIPVVKLTKVFRYGIGSLTTVATDIRNGKPYLSNNGEKIFDNPTNNQDYSFVYVNDNPLQQVIEQYEKLLKKYSVKDIMVLTCFNVGNFGTYVINNAIQEIVNPPKPNEETMEYNKGNTRIMFRKGDKVINIVNSYDVLTPEKMEYEQYLDALKDDFDSEEREEPKKVNVMNGDIGYIRKIEDKKIYIQFDENMVIFTQKDIYNLLLGYSCSIHRIQGSQAKAIITLYHKQHEKMLTRNLIYVGDTRSQERLVEIADPQVINNALQIVETSNRQTWLGEMLLNGKI